MFLLLQPWHHRLAPDDTEYHIRPHPASSPSIYRGHVCHAGQRAVFDVGSRDEYGNTVAAGGVALQAYVKMQPHAADTAVTEALRAEVVDRGNGIWQISHDLKVACDFEVRASLLTCQHLPILLVRQGPTLMYPFVIS